MSKKKKNQPQLIAASDFVISSAKEVIGKIVSHYYDLEENLNFSQVKIIVLRISGGSSSNPKFTVRPVGSDDCYVCNLFNDYKNGEAELCDVTENEFIDATIDHLFTDEVSGEATWSRAEVVDVDVDSEDKGNPDFFVSYDNYTDSKNEWFLLPLMEDYLKEWVSFVDVYNAQIVCLVCITICLFVFFDSFIVVL